jgi:hypothetical protein
LEDDNKLFWCLLMLPALNNFVTNVWEFCSDSTHELLPCLHWRLLQVCVSFDFQWCKNYFKM